MATLSAEQFRDLCHELADCRANLDSCLDREAPPIAERLLALVLQLKAATLKRRNPDLERLRDQTVYSAMLAHARRGGEAP